MKSDKNILKPVFSLFWCLGAIFRGICSVSSPCTVAVHCACTVRALCVHCQNTHPHTHTRAQLRLETYRTLQKPGMAEEENRKRLRKTHVSVYVYELALSHRGCKESRKDFYIEISYNKYVGGYIHTNIRTYIRTCEHAATAQLGQKTRRQDFCRRLMEKILHHQTHLESWPSCSPFNIGFKKMSPKQRSWMTEILHRRAKLQNTTLKRGCGGTSHSVLSNMPAPVQDFFHQQYPQKVCIYPISKRFQKGQT